MPEGINATGLTKGVLIQLMVGALISKVPQGKQVVGEVARAIQTLGPPGEAILRELINAAPDKYRPYLEGLANMKHAQDDMAKRVRSGGPAGPSNVSADLVDIAWATIFSMGDQQHRELLKNLVSQLSPADAKDVLEKLVNRFGNNLVALSNFIKQFLKDFPEPKPSDLTKALDLGERQSPSEVADEVVLATEVCAWFSKYDEAAYRDLEPFCRSRRWFLARLHPHGQAYAVEQLLNLWRYPDLQAQIPEKPAETAAKETEAGGIKAHFSREVAPEVLAENRARLEERRARLRARGITWL